MSPGEDFSRFAKIIPEEYLPALANNLKRIPDFSWLIHIPHAEIARLQGGVPSNFPRYVPTRSCGAFAGIHGFGLNNTCDLPDDRLDFITAAPIVDFNMYLEFERERQFRGKNGLEDSEKRRLEDRLQEYGRVLRNNDKTEILYLPPFSDFSHGALVLLYLVCSVSVKLYHEALGRAGGSHRLRRLDFISC